MRARPQTADCLPRIKDSRQQKSPLHFCKGRTFCTRYHLFHYSLARNSLTNFSSYQKSKPCNGGKPIPLPSNLPYTCSRRISPPICATRQGNNPLCDSLSDGQDYVLLLFIVDSLCTDFVGFDTSTILSGHKSCQERFTIFPGRH